MSEFLYKTEIATLKQSNAELNNVISNLKTDLYDLNCEIERLRKVNPDYIKNLEEKVTEYEHREEKSKELILSISKEAKNNNKKHKVVRQLLSALQVEDVAIVETLIERYYKKRGVPKIIIAFLFGVLVSLVVWLISTYLYGEKFYNPIIETIKKVVN